jgi:SNF2 family DNA or RNA helicase
LTKVKVTKALRSVLNWQTLAQVLSTEENLAKIERMLEEVRGLMEGLGGARKGKGAPKSKGPFSVTGMSSFLTYQNKIKGLLKISKEAFAQLATEEDVDNLFHLYNDLLSENEDTSEPPLIPSNSLRIPFAEGVDGADPGVEVEAKMPPDQLSVNLGFTKDHLPFQFNPYHHSKGFSTWDSPSMFKAGQPDIQTQGLHYHQLAGVHAVIRKIFSDKPNEGPCRGILLADEVGLGKTAMAISVMAFLSHLVLLQASEAPLPPIIGKPPLLRNYFHLQ